jgi:hypothetical protein
MSATFPVGINNIAVTIKLERITQFSVIASKDKAVLIVGIAMFNEAPENATMIEEIVVTISIGMLIFLGSKIFHKFAKNN